MDTPDTPNPGSAHLARKIGGAGRLPTRATRFHPIRERVAWMLIGVCAVLLVLIVPAAVMIVTEASLDIRDHVLFGTPMRMPIVWTGLATAVAAGIGLVALTRR